MSLRMWEDVGARGQDGVVLWDVCVGVGVGLLDAVDKFVSWGERGSRDVLHFGGQCGAEEECLPL